MGNRRGIFVAILVLGSSLLWQWAAPLSAQQKQGAGESGKKDDAKEKATEKDLDLRYAKAYVRVMEATLAKYQETNRRLPNTIRPTVIQAIQEGLREAQERVKLVDGDATNDGDIFVSGAEAELREEQEALRKAEAANVQFSGTISAEEIALLKARVELATINLQKAKHLGAESDLSNVRFELEQLREEVAELRMYVALLRDRN